MSKPRKWTLCNNTNHDKQPPDVIAGPDISPYEMEVDVIELSAYLALESRVKALTEALWHYSSSMDHDTYMNIFDLIKTKPRATTIDFDGDKFAEIADKALENHGWREGE